MQRKPLGNLVCVKKKPNGTVTRIFDGGYQGKTQADIDRMIDRMTYLNMVAMQQMKKGE